MSESEEESSNSENNWPMNEDWMLNILKDDEQSEAKVKINVNKIIIFISHPIAQFQHQK